MPNILVFVNIHQSRTTASKIEIIQKNITKRILSWQKFIPEFTPYRTPLPANSFPTDKVEKRLLAVPAFLSVQNTYMQLWSVYRLQNTISAIHQ
jgi:hypothetical protein